MVDVAPFKGLTYNTKKIEKLDNVMSPPYDIISESMQQLLYDKHPQNFVRLILGKQYSDDTDQNNRYTRAKHLFDEWQQQEILLASESEAIYPYRIEYSVKNQKKIMNGFFVLLQLDPEYKTVKAHEKTLAKPKADRLNLIRSCYANLEPIELLYMDESDSIRKTIEKDLSAPLFSVKGYDGFTHSLWKVDNTRIVHDVIQQLKKKILFIADGHHRYQTSINYAREQYTKTKETRKDAPYNYIMVVLVNMFDPGLAILPTHRLITLPDFDVEKLINNMRQYFSIQEKTIPESYSSEQAGKHIMADIENTQGHTFALYYNKNYYVFTLQDESVMDELAPSHSKTWRTLDVSILHRLILEHGLGITDTNIEDHVKYTRVEAEAVQLVNEKKYICSFFMNATKISELEAVANAGEHMPQKSTYFLPKMLSGLVMYKMG